MKMLASLISGLAVCAHLWLKSTTEIDICFLGFYSLNHRETGWKLLQDKTAYRYFWSVLKSSTAMEHNGFLASIGSKRTTGFLSQVCCALPIVPEKALGPVVGPSKQLSRCRKGNSFIYSRQINQLQYLTFKMIFPIIELHPH